VLPTGVTTAVAAALVFGVYLFLYKRSFSGLPATVYVAALEGVGLVWYAGIAALTWPAGESLVPPGTTLPDGLLLVGVCLVVAAANLVTMRAFKLGDVSYVAPLNKLVPVFVLPIEVALLSASLGVLQVAGVGVAAVAIYLANYEGGGLLAPFRRAASYTPARLALAGAVVFALADVGTRGVLSLTDFAPQTVALATFGTVAATAAPLAVGRLDAGELRAALPGLVPLAGLFAVGVHLTTISFAVAPASIVSPVVNTQAVVAVLLGGVLLREEGLPRRLGAAVLAVGGIALVAVG
jgi:drug/metabolite transporter (DMT)-like permease